MSITVAVTGGIGAGKSTLSGLLAARGAVVVDSDRLAREVVSTATPGLAAVARQFGNGVLAADGSLDRAVLASIVFTDAGARRQLEAITHPLVRARFAELQAAAPSGSVVINDIPLLTTRSAAAAFHLVVGVGAPTGVRVARLVDRGMSAADATARIAAQIDDESRSALCDVWVDNGAAPGDLRRRADQLWSRLRQFATNVEQSRGAPRGTAVLVPYDPRWPEVALRLVDRLHHVVGDHRIDHIGSTAVPGLWAKDVIDLQLTVRDLDQAGALGPRLAAAGFPLVAGLTQDTPRAAGWSGRPAADFRSARWLKAVHVNADPDRSVNLHLRVRDWPNWAWSLRFRDWLRSDMDAGADYLAVKQAAEHAHRGDSDAAGYTDAKDEFLTRSEARIRAWADSVGWQAG